MTQGVDSDLKAIAPVGIDAHTGRAFGVEIEVEDQGLETEAEGQPLQMSARSLLGTEGDMETEAGDISAHQAIGLDEAVRGAFAQFTKVLKPIGIALDFMAVERVGPPVLEFRHWGQTDVYFGGPEMDVPFNGLP